MVLEVLLTELNSTVALGQNVNTEIDGFGFT
jgi:hypothetical protein